MNKVNIKLINVLFFEYFLTQEFANSQELSCRQHRSLHSKNAQVVYTQELAYYLSTWCLQPYDSSRRLEKTHAQLSCLSSSSFQTHSRCILEAFKQRLSQCVWASFKAYMHLRSSYGSTCSYDSSSTSSHVGISVGLDLGGIMNVEEGRDSLWTSEGWKISISVQVHL